MAGGRVDLTIGRAEPMAEVGRKRRVRRVESCNDFIVSIAELCNCLLYFCFQWW